MKKPEIIVSLDGMDRDTALVLAWNLSSRVWGFKVNDLLVEYGLEIVRALRCLGRVFADPKFHDIPQTVANGVVRLADAGADMITVHAAGGQRMIEKAVNAAGSTRIIAVTVLTSFDESECQQTYSKSVEETVWDLGHLAYDAGAHGMVCAPTDLNLVKHLKFSKIVPGVRLKPVAGDDQTRTGIPTDCDYVVIGRPITQSADPLNALQQFIDALAI